MSLQVWLPLNGNLDNQGLTPVTVTNNGAIVDNNGKIGKCYSFDGSDDYIRYTGVDISGWTQLSVSCWVYFTSTLKNVFGFSDPNSYWQFIIYNNTLEIRDNGTGQSGTRKSYSLGTNTADTWIHFCFTYNSGVVNIYRNGELLSTNNTGGTCFNSNVNICTIGSDWASGTSSYCFPGKINDFRVYDHVLSVQEVKKLAQGLILHYPLNYANLNLLKKACFTNEQITAMTVSNAVNIGEWKRENSQVVLSMDGSYVKLHYDASTSRYGIHQEFNLSPNTYTMSIKTGGRCTLSCGLATGWPSTNVITSNAPGIYSTTFTVTEETTYRIYIYTTSSNPDIWFNFPKIEVGSSVTKWMPHADELENYNIIYDITGYKNHGTVVGSLTAAAGGPRYKSSTVFDSGSYIKKTDFNYASNIWSVSCWFKKTSNVTSSFETILGLTRGDGTDTNKKFSLYIKDAAVGFAGEQIPHSSLITIDKTKWHHVCITSDGSSHKYYLDGALKNTFSNTTNLIDCTDFVVGGRAAIEDAASIGTPWGGNISDVRFYATALNADDIAELYALGNT